ncbi:MAG TPA: tetratricopeptide repeat protein [Arcobacter sp.]|nr:tetratricopeptide repeat protein [Arcobacter sp.]
MNQHHLKIFISSTFLDMNQEREELLKKVFVKFKKLAKQRGVEVTEIELRTGVTNATGHVAKVCLELVDKCVDSPIFFIGILGESYGWDGWYALENKQTLNKKHRDIVQKYADRSVTELEIRYAIKDKNHNQAFFYVTKPTANEDKRLVSLKNELQEYSKERKNLMFDYYVKDEGFSEKVYYDLEKALNEVYPLKKKESEIEKLRAPHNAFAMSRYKGYVKSKKNEEILNQFLLPSNSQNRLLLYGESGYGKSALITNYFSAFKKKHKEYFIIEHYIGGAGELSNDFYQMLRRVMLEIKEEFNLSDDVPTDNETILNEFTEWLHKVKRKTIIVFDGYTQIEDEVKGRFLEFYLANSYDNVKLIVTAIDSNYKIENKQQINKLTIDEKKDFIKTYLDIYGKHLSYDVNKLINHSQVDNTLFLRTLLEEIRLLGQFETVGEDIANYLKSKDVKELFVKIFARYERDYDTNLVKEIISLIHISRDGLNENNLLEMIEQHKRVDRYEFYPILLVLEEHLIDRNGLYTFSHDYIKEAVEEKYVWSDEVKNDYRRKLINYFENQDIDLQRVRELPFQLIECRDQNGLYRSFMDIDFFVRVQEMDEYELLKYIQFIDKSKKYDIVGDITEKLMLKKKSNAEDARIINTIAGFFDLLYVNQYEALLLYEKALVLYSKIKGNNHQYVAICHNNVASIYDAMGKHKKAHMHYRMALKINKDNLEYLPEFYNNLAGNYHQKARYKKALKYYQKSLKIRKKEKNVNYLSLAILYNNMAELYSELGEYQTALKFHLKALSIRKKYLPKNYPNLAITYSHLALTYDALGKKNKALYLYKKSLDIDLEVYGETHPHTATAYENYGNFLYNRGELNKALQFLEKSLKITKRTLGSKHVETAISYNNLANIYHALGKYKKALDLYRKSLKIKIRVLGLKHNIVAESYNNLAIFYHEHNKYTKSQKYMKRAIKIWKMSFSIDHPHLINAYAGLEEIKLAIKNS